MPYLVLSFLFGIFMFQIVPSVIPNYLLWLLSLLLGVVCCYLKDKYLILGLAFIVGFAYVEYRTQDYLAARMHKITTNKTVIATGKIASVPDCIAGSCKFKFLIVKLFPGEENNFYYGISAVTWQGAVKLSVGQEWQLALKLKSPHMTANPGSFDLERFYLTQKIVTTGYVVTKETTVNKLLNDCNFSYPIGRMRQFLSGKILAQLKGSEFSQFIVALTVGVRNNILPRQNIILQNTGTAHLMAISGLHIGFVALLALYGVNFLAGVWLKYLNISSHKIAAIAAVIFAASYSILSGLQIPALRAVVMIAVYMLGKVATRSITGWQSFYFSLLVVLLVDPVAVYSAGFWLSFMAVFMLLYTASSNLTKHNWLLKLLKVQLILLIGLLALSLGYFSKISLISPLANLIAVPIVSFWVVPLAILGVMLQFMSVHLARYMLELAHLGFSLVWRILEYLAAIPMAQLNFFQLNLTSMLLACIGSLWILSPKGFPHRYLGIVCFLPAFFPGKSHLVDGEFRFTMLDVGQGLATVIETKQHILLYDTGLKHADNMDSATSVILPFLSTLRVKNIDTMLISHPDLDHFGGATAIAQNTQGVKTAKLIINDITVIDKKIFKSIEIQQCRAGQSWHWDGVDFKILHPSFNPIGGKNEYSCVLKISNKRGSILLPGDISAKVEKQLINLYADSLRAEVLIVAHHGSKSSSSINFLQHVQPKVALISAGYLNRYKHPATETLLRLAKIGSNVLTTEVCGAISILFSQNIVLQPECYRKQKQVKF
jgi:competence protein ComEC